MQKLMTSASLSVLALSALIVLPQPASAACVPGVRSDTRQNTCLGTDTLGKIGSQNRGNTAVGTGALQNVTSDFNTAVGSRALGSATTGSGNTALGVSAMGRSTTGYGSVAVGNLALGFNTTGYANTGLGYGALDSNRTGIGNTALGFSAGASQTGSYNIAIGPVAGSAQKTGSNNIAIGTEGAEADDGTIRIGVQGKQTKAFIAGIRGSTVSLGSAVLVDRNGQLGVLTSSARYKQDIAPMAGASEQLTRLRPVTFRYKEADGAGNRPLQYGLIAEEVAQVMPELVVRNADGSVETVAYQYLPSLLLNEFQKQNRELTETRAQLESMQQELAAMKAALGRLAAAPQGSTLAALDAADAVTLE